MKMKIKFLLVSILPVIVINFIISMIVMFTFSSEINKLNYELYSAKLEKILYMVHSEDDLYFSGIYKTEDEAKEKALDRIRESFRKEQNQRIYYFILDQDGKVIYHPQLKRGNDSYIGKELTKTMDRTASGSVETGDQGKKDWVIFNRYDGWGWKFCFVIPVDLRDMAVYKFNIRMTIISIIVIGLSLVLIGLFVNAILLYLSKLVGLLKNISSGEADLTKRIKIESKDEIGELAAHFNRFIDKINADLLKVEENTAIINTSSEESSNYVESSAKQLETIKSGFHEIDIQTENSTSAVEELTATVEEMSRNIDSIMGNMERQAAAVEEGASSIEEMVRNIENTAHLSTKTKDISGNLNSVSIEGSNAVKDSIHSIKEVSDFSQQILKLLGLISNIAKQTNLLAMNAAIEAAHAGEAGKGFAIVADEIRRLSEDTNKNARDIGDVVSSIVTRINDSVGLAEKAGIGLDMIIAYSRQNVEIISQLNIAISEQNNGAKDILKATQEMVKITEEVKMAMVEQKNATDDFSGALRGLRDLSLQYKDNITTHVDDLTEMVTILDILRKFIQENRKVAVTLAELLGRFKLDKTTVTENTGLKLVE